MTTREGSLRQAALHSCRDATAANAVEASGGGIVKGPCDDAHERRVVVYDNKGNGVVFYRLLAR